LLFKLWKSHSGLARYREGAPALERLALFYAKLLGVLLQHWLLLASAWQSQPFSLLKAARLLQEQVKRLLLGLHDNAQVEEILRRLQQEIHDLAQVQPRCDHPSHAQLLNAPELLDWAA
jgi:hypothetical protein